MKTITSQALAGEAVELKPSGQDSFSKRTIKDIAREAGVSTATVSRVLNTPDRVTQKRRDAVLEVVSRHDYVTHGMAGALAGARTRNIGLVIPTITNSIYAASTHAIQRLAQRENHCVFLGVSDFSPDEERRVIRRFIEQRVDGLILTGGGRDPAIYRLIDRHKIPYVVTWRLDSDAKCPCISFDNYAAGRMAMKHLLDLGHSQIGLICGRTEVNDRAKERRNAYEDTLREAGIALDTGLIFEREFEYIEGKVAMRRMLEAPVRPTAVFAANDIQAIGAIAQCRENGLSVPSDISVIGFDDLPVAEFIEPKLTTIRVPAQRMGHVAASHLLQMIQENVVPQSEVLPVELILRGTTRALPSGSGSRLVVE